jgi:hypothetical protein
MADDEQRSPGLGQLESGDLTRLFRAFARATLQATSILTRVEAVAALPRGFTGEWLDAHVKPRVVGDAEFFVWGDVLASLHPSSATRRSSPAGYMTCDEAAEYLGYRSAAALRMAVGRKQIAPTARRGRTLLFTRADLDRQLAPVAHESSAPPAAAPSASPSPTAETEGHVAKIEIESAPPAPGDPFGLRGKLAHARETNGATGHSRKKPKGATNNVRRGNADER